MLTRLCFAHERANGFARGAETGIGLIDHPGFVAPIWAAADNREVVLDPDVRGGHFEFLKMN